MSRDFSCTTGRVPYKTKAEATTAANGDPVGRCRRCRWWHVHVPMKRAGGTRK